MIINIKATQFITRKSASYNDLIGFPQNLHDILTVYCLILSEIKFFAREMFYHDLYNYSQLLMSQALIHSLTSKTSYDNNPRRKRSGPGGPPGLQIRYAGPNLLPINTLTN